MLKCQKTGSGIFIAEEVDGGGDWASGNTTMVNLETTSEAFLDDCRLQTVYPNCKSIRISGVSATTLKEFYCISTSICIKCTLLVVLFEKINFFLDIKILAFQLSHKTSCPS
jgi:hypothetical protein